MANRPLIPIGTLTPGVGRCWLVDICYEDGPVGEAWSQAYTSQRRARDDIIAAYGADVIRFAPLPSGGWLVGATEPDE